MNDILFFYCDNEMKQLKKVCYPLLIKIGGISEKDYDDFYSIALEALMDSVNSYNEKENCKFTSFLTGNIQRRFNSEIRNRNRKKQIPASELQSLNIKLKDTDFELEDIIPSDFDLFDIICEQNDIKENKIEKYLNRLSSTQRKIVSMLSDGFTANEIKEILHMNSRQYSQNMAAIQSYENVKLLMQ